MRGESLSQRALTELGMQEHWSQDHKASDFNLGWCDLLASVDWGFDLGYVLTARPRTSIWDGVISLLLLFEGLTLVMS